MEENIKRLNTILIYEHSCRLIKKEFDSAFYRMTRKDHPLDDRLEIVTVDWASLFSEDSDEVCFAQAIPHIMLLSFCVEIAIKTLSIQRGKEIKGHSLDKLFRELDINIQNQIIKEVTTDLKITKQHFNDSISINNSGFIDYRYAYEKSHASINDSFLSSFLKSIKNQIIWA